MKARTEVKVLGYDMTEREARITKNIQEFLKAKKEQNQLQATSEEQEFIDEFLTMPIELYPLNCFMLIRSFSCVI